MAKTQAQRDREREFYAGFTPLVGIDRTRPHPGDRVLILGDHPHAGKVGTYIRNEPLGMLPGRSGARVEFDDGTACFVLKANEFRKVEA